MAFILFDCTQFISFDFKPEIDINTMIKNFERIHFSTLVDSEIKKTKINLLKKYLHANTIELINDEFIADFQEWIDEEEIPHSIMKFSNLVKRVIENENIESLNIVLVRYFYETIEKNIFTVVDVSESEIINGLFNMSCYGEAGNILILKVLVQK